MPRSTESLSETLERILRAAGEEKTAHAVAEPEPESGAQLLRKLAAVVGDLPEPELTYATLYAVKEALRG